MEVVVRRQSVLRGEKEEEEKEEGKTREGKEREGRVGMWEK
jgi:hypothetical protein